MSLDLVLASSSSYRKELLKRLDLPFRCENPKINEEIWKKKKLPPQELAQILSFEKSMEVFKQHPQSFVIGCDQVAELEGNILSKPMSVNRHQEILSQMQGKTHHLWNGMTIVGPNFIKQWVHLTKMTMRELTTKEIEWYVSKNEALDCSGGYKIEASGITLFSKVETDDPSAIEGLPLISLGNELRKIQSLLIK